MNSGLARGESNGLSDHDNYLVDLNTEKKYTSCKRTLNGEVHLASLWNGIRYPVWVPLEAGPSVPRRSRPLGRDAEKTPTPFFIIS
jgi:hypothetical protein